MNSLMTAAHWLTGQWPITVAATVAIGAAWLMARATRRAALAPGPLTPQNTAASQADRAQSRERQGRRIEDALTLVVAAAAAYLSSTGLRKFGRDVMGLEDPWDWLPFVGLDVAALVCGMRARRRAHNGGSSGLSGLLFWALIAASAFFSASEADDFIGGVARAAWPLISGVLFELGSLEERLAARERLRRELGLWLERKVAAVRMLHPVEWLRVQMALAADETISQDTATRQVRIERAGYWLYRLRCLQERHEDKNKKLWLLPTLRINRADRRAQTAQARVSIKDYGLVLEAVQLRVRTRDFASLNYSNAAAAEKALSNLIGTRLGTPGTDRRTGMPIESKESRSGTIGTASALRAGTEALGTEARASTVSLAKPDCTGTDAARSAAVPRTGTDGMPPCAGTVEVPRATRASTDDDVRYDRSDQVSAGTESSPGTTAMPRGTDEHDDRHDATADESGIGTDAGTDGPVDDDTERADEEELVRLLRAELKEDGTFRTGGIGKVCARFSIGTTKAKRVMENARALGPLGTESETASDHDEASDDAEAEETAGPAVIETVHLPDQPIAELLTTAPCDLPRLVLAGPAAAAGENST